MCWDFSLKETTRLLPYALFYSPRGVFFHLYAASNARCMYVMVMNLFPYGFFSCVLKYEFSCNTRLSDVCGFFLGNQKIKYL